MLVALVLCFMFTVLLNILVIIHLKNVYNELQEIKQKTQKPRQKKFQTRQVKDKESSQGISSKRGIPTLDIQILPQTIKYENNE